MKNGQWVTCGRCDVCLKRRRSDLVQRSKVELCLNPNVYLVTFTAPHRVTDRPVRDQLPLETDFTRSDLLAAFNRFNTALNARLKRKGLPKPAFLRTVEANKKKGLHHLHVVYFVPDGFDPVEFRKWPYLCDVRLAHGKGHDLDGHINKRNSFRWTRERRLAYDPKVLAAGLIDKKGSPIGAVVYATKYITKAIGADGRAYGTSFQFGHHTKLMRLLDIGTDYPKGELVWKTADKQRDYPMPYFRKDGSVWLRPRFVRLACHLHGHESGSYAEAAEQDRYYIGYYKELFRMFELETQWPAAQTQENTAAKYLPDGHHWRGLKRRGDPLPQLDFRPPDPAKKLARGKKKEKPPQEPVVRPPPKRLPMKGTDDPWPFNEVPF